MPRRDGTGPMRMGEMTGRGFGNCIRFGLPVLAGVEACFASRRGRGRSFGRQFSSIDELSQLKDQANLLEENLDEVKKRILELEQQ